MIKKQALAHKDRRTETFLALSSEDELLAIATLVSDPSVKHAEVAISTRADHKGLGISYTLLSHVADYAQSHGIHTIESCENRRNLPAIHLEHDVGFKMIDCPDDPELVILRKHLGRDGTALA